MRRHTTLGGVRRRIRQGRQVRVLRSGEARGVSVVACAHLSLLSWSLCDECCFLLRRDRLREDNGSTGSRLGEGGWQAGSEGVGCDWWSGWDALAAWTPLLPCQLHLTLTLLHPDELSCFPSSRTGDATASASRSRDGRVAPSSRTVKICQRRESATSHRSARDLRAAGYTNHYFHDLAW